MSIRREVNDVQDEVLNLNSFTKDIVSNRFDDVLSKSSAVYDTTATAIAKAVDFVSNFTIQFTSLLNLINSEFNKIKDFQEKSFNENLVLDLSAKLPNPPTLSSFKPSLLSPPNFNKTPPDYLTYSLNIPNQPVFSKPNIPTVSFPQMPVLTYNPIQIDIPKFDKTLTLPDIQPLNISFRTFGLTYTPLFIDLLKAKLTKIINTGLALEPEIEQAYYDREKERAEKELVNSKTKLADEWSRRGYSIPPAMFMAQVTDLERDFLYKRLDTSRDIAIEQAKLAVDSTHKAIASAIDLEGKWIQKAIEEYKAEIDYEKTRVSILLEAYKVQHEVQKLTAEIFNLFVNIYKNQIEAEGFKLQINKQKLEENKMSLEVYTAQLQGQLELLKAYIEQGKFDLETQKTQADIYKALLSAEEVKAQTIAEYNKSLSTQYATEAEIYKAMIDAFEAQIASLNLNVEIDKLLIQKYIAELDAVKTKLETEAKKADIYKTKADVFSSTEQVRISAYKTKVDAIVSKVNALVENLKTEISAYQASGQIKSDGLKSLAQIVSQFCVGLLSSISVAASVQAQAQSSAHGSASISYEHQVYEDIT